MTFGPTIRNGVSVSVGSTPSLGGNVLNIPAKIGSLAAWYRYGQGITQAGGFASAWADQSGNGRDLLQAAGVNQPAVNPDSSLLFNGTSHFMRVVFTLPQPATVCVLAKPVTWTSSDRLWNAAGFSAGPRVGQITSSALVQYACDVGGTTISASLGAYHAFVTVADGTSNVMRVDSSEVTGGTGTVALDGITLCAGSGGGSGWGNFEVKEAVVFSIGLSAVQRAQMVRYLAAVGGLSI